MRTKEEKIKISNGVIQGINLHRCILKRKEYALVGILASSKNTETINNIYFIKHRRGGCKWMPKLESRDIADAILKVLKEKRKIRGLVAVLARNTIAKMNTWFFDMIFYDNWANEKFVYIIRGENGVKCYKINKLKFDYKSVKFSII